VYRFDMKEWDDSDPTRPVATVEVRCSAGTYIRALARDLGERVGSGAYLGALTRTASGPFTLEQARPIDEVRKALVDGQVQELLLPMDTGLDHYPVLRLGAEDVTSLARGQELRGRRDAPQDGLVRVVDDSGQLVAIAVAEGETLRPEKVFAR
jgi:tRNA pseudouridine55 synthase